MQVDIDIDGLKLAKKWVLQCYPGITGNVHASRRGFWRKNLGKTCGATIAWYCWNFFGLGMEVGSGIGA